MHLKGQTYYIKNLVGLAPQDLQNMSHHLG